MFDKVGAYSTSLDSYLKQEMHSPCHVQEEAQKTFVILTIITWELYWDNKLKIEIDVAVDEAVEVAFFLTTILPVWKT